MKQFIVTVRLRGAKKELRKWGPYRSENEAGRAIDKKRDEAKRMGWGELVFEIWEETR